MKSTLTDCLAANSCVGWKRTYKATLWYNGYRAVQHALHWHSYKQHRLHIHTLIRSSASLSLLATGSSHWQHVWKMKSFTYISLCAMARHKVHNSVSPLIISARNEAYSQFKLHMNDVNWEVYCVWNVMAYVKKPDFVFQRNGWVRLNRQGASVQSTAGSQSVRISGSNAGCTVFWGSVKSTGYPIHLSVSPSLPPLPCVTVCHHISTGVYRNHTFICL
jgi:hypothetical protein